MSDLLLDRLREVTWSGKDRGRLPEGGTTCWHRNPEGPEAANEIELLREQLAERDRRIKELREGKDYWFDRCRVAENLIIKHNEEHAPLECYFIPL